MHWVTMMLSEVVLVLAYHYQADILSITVEYYCLRERLKPRPQLISRKLSITKWSNRIQNVANIRKMLCFKTQI